MANQYQLKMIVNYLENWAGDFEIVGKFLNLRVRPGDAQFTPSAYDPPAPRPYPTPDESMARAVELLTNIAENNAKLLTHVGAHPSQHSPYPGNHSNEELLHLVLDWLTLKSGIFKVIVELYGLRPLPTACLPHPGPASEERLYAEIAQWLEKIATDAVAFVQCQRLSALAKPARRSVPPAPLNDSLREFERQFHKLVTDYFALTAALPHHLRHANA